MLAETASLQKVLFTRGWAEQENEYSGHFNKLLKNYRFPYSSIVQLVPLCTIIYSIDFVCFFIFGRFHFMIFCFIWNRCAENRKPLPASHTFLANMDGWKTRKWNHATGFELSISVLWIHLLFSEIIAGKKLLSEIIAGRKRTLWIIFRIFCSSLILFQRNYESTVTQVKGLILSGWVDWTAC